MPMNRIIQKKRRELGLTQEQVAQYLGVSTPAVSKWETGITCPDIGLLPSLARLLKTDLNGLFCFQQDLSPQEISGFCKEISATAQTDGIQAAFARAEELLRQFPYHEELMQCVTMNLDGLVLASGLPAEEKAALEQTIAGWYRRLECSDDSKIRNTAHYMMASRHIRLGELDKAQETLDKMPDRDAIVKDYADKLLLQVSIYTRRGEPELAAGELERALLQAVNRVQLLMCNLACAEQAAGEQAIAASVAEKSQRMARLLDMWEYTSYVAPYQLAVEEKDAEKTLPLLRQMLRSALRSWDMAGSPLYHRIAGEREAALSGQMLAAFLSELERDGELEYLRDDARFHSLIGEFREKLNGRM